MSGALLLAFSLFTSSSLGAELPIVCQSSLSDPLRPEEIYYEAHGRKGAPAVVLIHGLGGTHEGWEEIIENLSPDYQVIVYDQRGHGQSSERGWDYNLDVMSSDLLSLLNHLGIDKAYLVGHSFGARTAMKFAERYPSRVSGVVIEDMELIAREVDYEDYYRAKARKAEGFSRFWKSRDALYYALLDLFSAEESEYLVEDRTRDRPDRGRGWVEFTLRPKGLFLYDIGANGADLTSALVSYPGPVVFFRANPKDSYMFEEGVKHVQKHRPEARILTFWKADHNIHHSAKDEYLRELRAFLSWTRTGRRP